MAIPTPSPRESLGALRWASEKDTASDLPDQLAHYVSCSSCALVRWDGGATSFFEPRLSDLLAVRQWLEERLAVDPTAPCASCGQPTQLIGLRYFVRSETLERDLVLDLEGQRFEARFLDGQGVSPPVPSSDPRLRGVFLDALCRAAHVAASLGPERASAFRAPLEEAQRQAPRAPEPWIALAHLLLALDASRRRVREALDQAVKRADGLGFHGLARLARGFASLADHPRGKDAEAATETQHWLREALRLRPSATELQYDLGQRLYEASDLEGAEPHLAAAMQDPEHSLDAAYLLGRAALRQGLHDRAQAIFREIVRAAGPVPHFLRMRALAETAAGDAQLGAELLADAQSRDPDNPENDTIAAAMRRFSGPEDRSPPTAPRP